METPRLLNKLNSNEAREYLCRTASYFDMELPTYFNFEPLLECSLLAAQQLELKEIRGWKPQDHDNLNYVLMYNKDGNFGWRPFELMHPLIYAKCVEILTNEENWSKIKARFEDFSGGVVECCSIPVVSLDRDQNAKKDQISNWWQRIEQRSLELSLEYSHISLTDVSNCYPSIYSHSIAWALHGREFAKNNRGLEHFGNQIDKLISASREGQTNGIPQASLLSHLIAELILGYCDTYISKKLKGTANIKILRYRDDFRIFSNSDTDCATGLKAVSECLHIFGMKLGAAKTSRSSNVVVGAVKQDKISALSINRQQTTLQKELLLIHRFCMENPGSGGTKFLLRGFLDKVESRLPRNSWKIENPTALTAILLEIAAITPAVFPAVATTISKIMKYLSTSKREEIFELVLKRTSRIPNNEYMMLWLQRIALPNRLNFSCAKKMCSLVNDANASSLWNNSWIKHKKTQSDIEQYSIIDRSILTSIPEDIQSKEFDVFWNKYH